MSRFGGKLAASTLIFGIGIGIGIGYKKYTRDVTTIIETQINPSISELIKEKTMLTPHCTSYRIPITADNVSPKSLVNSMFSSWVMAPEKLALWMTIPEYQTLSTNAGSLIYGMFKVEISNPEMAVLYWKLAGMAGLHVFSTHGRIATFDTIFWYENTPPSLLNTFHDMYSKALLKAAVNNAGSKK